MVLSKNTIWNSICDKQTHYMISYADSLTCETLKYFLNLIFTVKLLVLDNFPTTIIRDSAYT